MLNFLWRTSEPNPITSIRRCNAWRSDGKTGSKIFSVPLVVHNEKVSEIDVDLDARRVSMWHTEAHFHAGYKSKISVIIRENLLRRNSYCDLCIWFSGIWQCTLRNFMRHLTYWYTSVFHRKPSVSTVDKVTVIVTETLTFCTWASHRNASNFALFRLDLLQTVRHKAKLKYIMNWCMYCMCTCATWIERKKITVEILL